MLYFLVLTATAFTLFSMVEEILNNQPNSNE